MSKRKKNCLKHKLRYADREEALSHMPLYRGPFGPMMVWKCSFCDGYHVGHPVQVKILVTKYGSWEEAKKQATREEARSVMQAFQDCPGPKSTDFIVLRQPAGV
jgi:hypothetical protein